MNILEMASTVLRQCPRHRVARKDQATQVKMITLIFNRQYGHPDHSNIAMKIIGPGRGEEGYLDYLGYLRTVILREIFKNPFK